MTSKELQINIIANHIATFVGDSAHTLRQANMMALDFLDYGDEEVREVVEKLNRIADEVWEVRETLTEKFANL